MIPPQHVRLVLQEFRNLGTPFHLAWANAMRTLPRRGDDYPDWKRALAWARPAYQAAYEGKWFYPLEVPRGHTRLVYAEEKPTPEVENPERALLVA